MSVSAAWRLGADLALEMLEEAYGLRDEAALKPTYREGRPQKNFVVQYLRRVHEANDPQTVEGFGAVLSDYISSAQDGAVPDVELLRSGAAEVRP